MTRSAASVSRAQSLGPNATVSHTFSPNPSELESEGRLFSFDIFQERLIPCTRFYLFPEMVDSSNFLRLHLCPTAGLPLTHVLPGNVARMQFSRVLAWQGPVTKYHRWQGLNNTYLFLLCFGVSFDALLLYRHFVGNFICKLMFFFSGISSIDSLNSFPTLFYLSFSRIPACQFWTLTGSSR